MSREFGHLRPITVGVADKLRDELRSYDPDTVLFDGLTAADSLRYVINVPKILGSPRVMPRTDGSYKGGIMTGESITAVDRVVVDEARKRGRHIGAAAGMIFFQ